MFLIRKVEMQHFLIPGTLPTNKGKLISYLAQSNAIRVRYLENCAIFGAYGGEYMDFFLDSSGNLLSVKDQNQSECSKGEYTPILLELKEIVL